MKFTPEEIAIQRAFFARAHPTDRYPLWFDITEWEQVARTTHADALTVIEQQRAEIERLREVLKRCRIWSDEPERIAAMIDTALKGGEK